MLRFFKSRTNLGVFSKSQFDYKKIRNGEKSRFLYGFLKTNNTPIELLWFRFGVLFILEVTIGFEPMDNGVADRGLTTWLRHHKIWSGLRGSNPPPRPWQGRALPNELNPRFCGNKYYFSCLKSSFAYFS